ncbi:MAG: transglutaminase-like domain-containing protein [Fibrobacteria bacterium]
MAEDKDLVHILRLLDDESPKVRDRVWGELEANLPAWEAGIRARLEEIPSGPRRKLMDLLSSRERKGFRAAWLRWRDMPTDMEKLEVALSGLSWYLAEERLRVARSGRLPAGEPDRARASEGEAGSAATGDNPHYRENVDYHAIFESGEEAGGTPASSRNVSEVPVPRHPGLGEQLDGLAAEFRRSGSTMSPTALARFLFTEKGLRGAEGDYYNPANSDLAQVIASSQGIPITLACVFMLVGHRLGFAVHGCDVPEHFLTRVREEGGDVVIDCFDGGKVLGPDKLAQLERKYAPEFARLLKSKAEPEAIVARVLRNLINAYHLAGERQASQFMWSLAEDLRGNRD